FQIPAITERVNPKLEPGTRVYFSGGGFRTKSGETLTRDDLNSLAQEHGYQPVILPKTTVEARVDFILGHL
ncbi:MAG: hypothetical protein ABGW90_00220, partial [Martelella sp.]